jgi:hypothetical protein
LGDLVVVAELKLEEMLIFGREVLPLVRKAEQTETSCRCQETCIPESSRTLSPGPGWSGGTVSALLSGTFPGFYRALLRHLPGSTAYQNLFEITTLKLDHFRHRDQRSLNDGWTEALPAELKDFWNRFNEWFYGADLAEAVLDSFAESLRARLGEKRAWPPVSVESQLIRVAPAFRAALRPAHKLVVLLYLAPMKALTTWNLSIVGIPASCPNSAYHSRTSSE